MNVRGFESGASSDVNARLLRWFVFIALFVWLGRAAVKGFPAEAGATAPAGVSA